ncbi:hypothetical protein [Legionella sp. WA2022007384]
MTFKEFMKAVAYLPANAFTGSVKLVLGYTDEDGEEHRGLLGLATDGIKFVGRSISDFLSEHKKAITTAAWLTLATAGAVALTLFLWPAALTAVASFSVYGLSIAGIAGANTLAQIGLASALAGAAVSAATYIGAAAGNFFSWVAKCCKNLRSSTSKQEDPQDDEDDTYTTGNEQGFKSTKGSSFDYEEPTSDDDLTYTVTQPKGNPLSILSTSGAKEPTITTNVVTFAPQQHQSPIQSPKVVKKDEDAPSLNQTSSLIN